MSAAAQGRVPVEFHTSAVDQRLIQQRSVGSTFQVHLPVIEIHLQHSVSHSLPDTPYSSTQGFHVPLDTKQVTSETFLASQSLG